MSQLSNSLEERIQELTQSIEAQKAQLAAYEHALHLERGGQVAGEESEAEMPVENEPVRADHKEEVAAAPFTGNKTSMVVDVIRSRGSMGATPKEVDAYFSARNIKRSKNLIYNTLSYLVAHNKLERRDGRYFLTETALSSPRKKVAVRAKRRLSPEGLKRIREALRKRWAAKRAAGVAAKPAASKRGRKKKSVSQ